MRRARGACRGAARCRRALGAARPRGNAPAAVALTALSAALYAASFPPLALRALAWIALVPFLVALRDAAPRPRPPPPPPRPPAPPPARARRAVEPRGRLGSRHVDAGRRVRLLPAATLGRRRALSDRD